MVAYLLTIRAPAEDHPTGSPGLARTTAGSPRTGERPAGVVRPSQVNPDPVSAPLISAAEVSTSQVSASAGVGGACSPAVDPARAGLIVGKSVGNSVVRHRVSRRLREQLRPVLVQLGPADRLVIRALPVSASRSSAELASDLGRAVRRLGAAAPARRT